MTLASSPGPGGWITGTSCGAFLTLEAITASGRTGQVRAVLRYTVRDPYAVRLECHSATGAPAVWCFARETLEAGLRGRAGRGSILVCADAVAGGSHTFILLDADKGHCVLRGETTVFRSFLASSKKLVPYGEERDHISFDALVDLRAPSPKRDGRPRARWPKH